MSVTQSDLDEVSETLNTIFQALTWVVSDLTDAGVEFEHAKEIKFFLDETDKLLEGKYDDARPEQASVGRVGLLD